MFEELKFSENIVTKKYRKFLIKFETYEEMQINLIFLLKIFIRNIYISNSY